MKKTRSTTLDLIILPPLQRKILVHLAREGPSDLDALARLLAQPAEEVQQALTALLEQGRVCHSSNGQVQLAPSRTRRRTLPARLWPALLAANRLYSAQEIMTLRTVVPILQLARAKLGEFVDHGPGHALRVKSFATQLGYVLGLTATEQHLLRAAALFHDVGNIVERERHHIISQEVVEKLALAGELPFSLKETELVGLLCRWHRRDYDPDRGDELQGEPIRTGLLASILRVADAMDIDYRRSDYNQKSQKAIQIFYAHEYFWFVDAEAVFGIRIRCTPAVNLQVFMREQVSQNHQVALLHRDLAGTPLGWSVQEINVDDEPYSLTPADKSGKNEKKESALLVFPFDPHGLVMAALSRKHLQAAGHTVELLVYPDTHGAPAWLWGEALTEVNPADYTRLVVIGDRPDPTCTATMRATLDYWHAAEVRLNLMNRHEANWTRLPDLLQWGVEVILGGDWAYFWGEAVSRADLVWARIAALCTRDPTQATVALTAEEQALTQGLLKVVFDATRQSPDDVEGWSALAMSILDRIAADDRAYFAAQASDFAITYATLTTPGRVKGRVLRFELTSAEFSQTCYWALEAAIEHGGRTPERGIHFNIPYAIATWPDGEAVELLAINHWREEEAIPIRLLYPTDVGPPPEGNENAIRVRLPAAQAEAVVQALIEACQQI